MDKTILVLADGTELCGGGPGDAVVSLTHRSAVNSGQDLTIGSACSDSIEAELWCEPGGSLRITEGDTITRRRPPRALHRGCPTHQFPPRDPPRTPHLSRAPGRKAHPDQTQHL